MLRTTIRAAAAILLLASVAGAQEWRQGKGRLEGTVKNTKGEPIADAVVSLKFDELGRGPDLKTNAKGYFAVMGLNGGKWDFDVSAPGYETMKSFVNVTEFQRVPPLNIVLQPEVKQTPATQEISVGGKKISKETADIIEKGNADWASAEKAENDQTACAGDKACADSAKKRRQESLEAALAGYEKTLVELPDNDSILLRLAVGNLWLQRNDAAQKYARQIVAKDPENSTMWLMIAQIDLQNGKFDEGKEALSHVPDERITDPTPYMNMGILYYNKNKPADAEEYFTKAIAKNAETTDAYYYRGLSRYQQKHMAGAKVDFRKYLELAPKGDNAEVVREILKTLK
ncbi:MAG: tetratricopeptide repeat protein [Thermoanaerobaculia bacterium]